MFMQINMTWLEFEDQIADFVRQKFNIGEDSKIEIDLYDDDHGMICNERKREHKIYVNVTE